MLRAADYLTGSRLAPPQTTSTRNALESPKVVYTVRFVNFSGVRTLLCITLLLTKSKDKAISAGLNKCTRGETR